MSRQNKVNPMQYHVAGRLTPDDAARERVKQRNISHDATQPRTAAAEMPARSATTREKHAAAPAATIARARTRTAGRSRG